VNTTSNEHALEVRDELIRYNFIPKGLEISSYEPLYGGADTTIFEISFNNHPKKYVQRIFRSEVSEKHAEFEYIVQKTLFDNKVSVPQPFLMKFTPNTLERPYFVMEKIEGPQLAEAFENLPEQFDNLMFKHLLELHKIHLVDSNLFPQLVSFDIQENPFAPIDYLLNRRKSFLEQYPEDLKELKPVFEWLEKHKMDNPCKKLVVVHGDYHGFNIIVQENHDLKILDWTGISISDFRRDLAFATTTLSSMFGKDLSSMVSEIYEQISGIKVENLRYFMVLENIFNLIRFYSGINNPTITHENEDTMNFFKTVKTYPLFLVDFIKETCNVYLHQIKEYFE
jgi:aminoglycoside phosphotransferase (APT) family kinase protein